MARPWTAFYPPGAKAELNEPPLRMLGEMPGTLAGLYGDKSAFTTLLPNGMAGSLTFSDVDRLSDAFAVFLRDGIGRQTGDRIAVQMPNSLAFVIAAFGIFKAGCTLVNVNPLYSSDEMGLQFADAKPQVLIIADMFAGKLPAALKYYHVPFVLPASVAEFFPWRLRFLVRFVQKFIKRQIPPCPAAHCSFASAVRLGAHLQRKKGVKAADYTCTLGSDALACLQYTGGTTGISKGAMLSHRNLLMNMAQSVEMFGHMERGEEVMLTVLPLYHIFAFTINLLGFYWLGAHNILIPDPRPLSNLHKAFELFPVSWITGVNTLFDGLNNSRWFSEHPPRTLKNAGAGGMALQTHVAKRWQEITGIDIIQGYGLTEASPVVAFNPNGRIKPESIGIPVPSTDVKCVDDNFVEVPQGEAGELAVKGPQVMLGYWHRPQETAKVLKDGWLLTGDIATIDNEGYIRIVDRKKDMIIHSGFKIFPNEVEDCLTSHPGVQEAAVIGVPDGAAGEAVKAFVVKRNPALTADELHDYCKQHLTAYKIPKFIEFRDELPKSNVGKILRKNLRRAADEKR